MFSLKLLTSLLASDCEIMNQDFMSDNLIIKLLILLHYASFLTFEFSFFSPFFLYGSSRMLKIILNVAWVNPTVLVTHLGLTSGEGEGVAQETCSCHHCPKDRVKGPGLLTVTAFPDLPRCPWQHFQASLLQLQARSGEYPQN